MDNLISSPHFSAKSLADGFGRVFFENGKVYRAIYDSEVNFCNELIQSPLFQKLVENKWIPQTTVSQISLEGFGMVLQHEKLQEIAPREWSFDMLKDAALLMWDMNNLCNEHGYELKDGHCFNILFRGTTPVFADIGSISPRKDPAGWFAYNQYLEYFVVPLKCWSAGLIFISRSLLASTSSALATIPNQPFDEAGILEMIPGMELNYNLTYRRKKILRVGRNYKLVAALAKAGNKLASLLLFRPSSLLRFGLAEDSLLAKSPFFMKDALRNNLLQLSPPGNSSAWQHYHRQAFAKDNQIEYSNRFKSIDQIIRKQEDVRSVIDLAGNEGYFCNLLAENGRLEKIILTDFDENAVNSAYSRFKAMEDPRLHALLLNFMLPGDVSDISSRLKCDLAVALAVTHHLILGNGFLIDAIFERIALYSSKYVLIEFMPIGLWGGEQDVKPVPEWYTANWFRLHFQKYFTLIHEEQTERNRIMFFGKIS